MVFCSYTLPDVLNCDNTPHGAGGCIITLGFTSRTFGYIHTDVYFCLSDYFVVILGMTAF